MFFDRDVFFTVADIIPGTRRVNMNINFRVAYTKN